MNVTTLNTDTFRDAMLLRISLACWPNRAVVKSPAALAEYLDALNAPEPLDDGTQQALPAMIDAPPTNGTNGKVKKTGSTTTSKRLVRCEAYDKLREFLTATKNQILDNYAVPSVLGPGWYRVRLDKVAEIDSLIKTAQKALVERKRDGSPGFLPAFLTAYPEAIDAARSAPVKKGGLGPLFVEADYPTPEEVAERFSVDANWWGLTVPDQLPPEIRQAQIEKGQAQIAEEFSTMRQTLRAGLAELIEHLLERTKQEPGEKPKIFRNSLVENFVQFLNVFENKNLTNDDELAAQVQRAKIILADVSPDKLRKDDDLRKRVTAGMASLKNAVDAMVTEGTSRTFDFDA